MKFQDFDEDLNPEIKFLDPINPENLQTFIGLFTSVQTVKAQKNQKEQDQEEDQEQNFQNDEDEQEFKDLLIYWRFDEGKL